MERLDKLDQFGNANFCELAERWGISTDLAWRLIRSADELASISRRSAFIISGFRTEAEQNELRRRGRPTAPPDRSTHTTCPATGADVWLGPAPPQALKVQWFRIVTQNGLRLGGCSGAACKIVDGMPSDWQHVDLGPRGGPRVDWRGPPVYRPPPGPSRTAEAARNPKAYQTPYVPSHNKIQIQQEARQQVRTLKRESDQNLYDLEFG